MMKISSRGATALMAAALLGLAGCAGGGTDDEGAPPAAEETPAAPETSAAPTMGESSAPAGAAELMTAESSLGEIVVDGKGMTVYYFTKDKKDSGTSNCTGDCLVAWPPVLTESETPTVEGVTAEVGTIDTPEGEKQVTIDGMPIYYWQNDKEPGDVDGQGVNDVWYVVAPDGTMIR
jgi:predicted lipoprotein with Yx(FWY)xxD motif